MNILKNENIKEFMRVLKEAIDNGQFSAEFAYEELITDILDRFAEKLKAYKMKFKAVVRDVWIINNQLASALSVEPMFKSVEDTDNYITRSVRFKW